MKTSLKSLFVFLTFLFFFPVFPVVAAAPVHALAMHGTPKYPADFKHFDYANPAAPKGGTLRLAVRGTFDSLNPYIVKGVAAPGVALIYQTLLSKSDDEAFTEYGDLAKSMEMPEDRSFVVFNLHENARWHDGKPLTAEDVVWTFNTLVEKGHPFYRAYYTHVKEAVAENKHRVRFVFDMAGNRELPLIMGQLPVLPKHYWATRDFGATSLELPLGSGPYRIKEIDTGRRITYMRVEDWWAKDLPVNKGQYNFDTIVYDLFRDESVLLQGFFSGTYDVRQENIAKAWHTQYDDQKPVQDGRIQKAQIPHEMPAGMQGFALNTRRAHLSDPRVRYALNHAFDFEWSNKKFAHGSYIRTQSYFANSELASKGLPSACELAILEPHRDTLPEEVFDKEFQNPKTDGSGSGVRKNLRTAKELLQEAGWQVDKEGVLRKDGQVFTLEFLIHSNSFERWIAPFVSNLKKLGINANIRLVDVSQYQSRIDTFNFDIVVSTFAQSLSPGNEQYDFWGSAKADIKGSRNVIGVKNPVIDDLIKKIVAQDTREGLICHTRALDRILLWNHYVIPQWHINSYRVAWWDYFGRPEIQAKYALGIVNTWWYDADKAKRIKKPE